MTRELSIKDLKDMDRKMRNLGTEQHPKPVLSKETLNQIRKSMFIEETLGMMKNKELAKIRLTGDLGKHKGLITMKDIYREIGKRDNRDPNASRWYISGIDFLKDYICKKEQSYQGIPIFVSGCDHEECCK